MESRKQEELNLLDLPDEILLSILCNLEPQEIVANVQLSNTHLKTLATDNILWREIFNRYFPGVFARMQEQEIIRTLPSNWMQLFKLQVKLEKLNQLKQFTLAYYEFCTESLDASIHCGSHLERTNYSTKIDLLKKTINDTINCEDWWHRLLINLIDLDATANAATFFNSRSTLYSLKMLYLGLADLLVTELQPLFSDDKPSQEILSALSKGLYNSSGAIPGACKRLYSLVRMDETTFEQFRHQYVKNAIKNDEVALNQENTSPRLRK